MISPSQRPLHDNTQHSQQTDIHALGGIQTRNPKKRAAADSRLRPRGHWDRQDDFGRINSTQGRKLNFGLVRAVEVVREHPGLQGKDNMKFGLR